MTEPISRTSNLDDMLTIRTLPSDPIYKWEVASDKGLFSAVIQNIAIINTSDSPLVLQHVTVEIMQGAELIQKRIFNHAELEGYARYMHGAQEQGMINALSFVFRPDDLLGDDHTLTSTITLAPKQAIFLTSHAFLIPRGCDTIRITAIATDDQNAVSHGFHELKVMEYQSKNLYRLPVRGTWYVSAGANLFSSHRWVVCQEFGLDLIQVGSSGGFYDKSGSRAEDYYCYNSDVMAAADGVVVAAVDEFEDFSSRLPQDNESYAEYWKRIISTSSELLVGEPTRAAGNYILISHDGGEYSLYGHLKPKSICVKENENVSVGQIIGRVGQSGNSPFPHLHFHVCDKEDFMFSRVLPVQFSNVSVLQRPALTGYLHTGDIVSSQSND